LLYSYVDLGRFSATKLLKRNICGVVVNLLLTFKIQSTGSVFLMCNTITLMADDDTDDVFQKSFSDMRPSLMSRVPWFHNLIVAPLGVNVRILIMVYKIVDSSP